MDGVSTGECCYSVIQEFFPAPSFLPVLVYSQTIFHYYKPMLPNTITLYSRCYQTTTVHRETHIIHQALFLTTLCLHPHTDTSRPPRAGEEERGEYEFVSRRQMERDIRNNQYVEHGYFNRHYYGTSIRSISNVVDSGRTCILVLIPSVSGLSLSSHVCSVSSGERAHSSDSLLNAMTV